MVTWIGWTETHTLYQNFYWTGYHGFLWCSRAPPELRFLTEILPRERGNPASYIRCKNIRCEAPEFMHSFPALFAFCGLWKQGPEMSNFYYSLSLSWWYQQLILVVAESWLQNITKRDIQSFRKFLSLSTSSGLLSWKNIKLTMSYTLWTTFLPDAGAHQIWWAPAGR